MLIGLVSAKGSPGVTTAALVLAACAGPDGLMIEMDPSGGSLESWTGVSGEPGLVRVASGLRRSLDPTAVEHGVISVPAGVASVLAPVSGQLAESTIAAIGERLTTAIAESQRTVVLDASPSTLRLTRRDNRRAGGAASDWRAPVLGCRGCLSN
jgi:MinD-like ATPase involved in chromosome partitioning or flagellar assembly